MLKNYLYENSKIAGKEHLQLQKLSPCLRLHMFVSIYDPLMDKNDFLYSLKNHALTCKQFANRLRSLRKRLEF
jgi:hypothetical protein